MPTISNFIANQWKETKKLTPKDMVLSAENLVRSRIKDCENSSGKPSKFNSDTICRIFFRRLVESFNLRDFDIPQKTLPCTAKEIANLQPLAMQIEDHSLVTFWEELQKELLLPNPPLTVDEIRTWLNNPANADQLKAFTNLNLSKKNLKTIPAEIKFLNNLTVLDLSNNQIAKLYLIGIRLQSLPIKTLNLSHNLMTNLLDYDVWSLPRSCEVLDLSCNSLEKLPYSAFPHFLKKLDISCNELKEAPDNLENFPSLEDLDFSSNPITHLPLSLLTPDYLKRVSFSYTSKLCGPAYDGTGFYTLSHKAETELWAWDMELVDDITYGMSM